MHALVVCARWETDSISEWICYHRHIGFDHVYLYCNDDDPSELYEEVLPFIGTSEGFVQFFHFGLQGFQREIYFHFLKNYSHECEWFIFLDVDEFLLLHNHDTIENFIGSFRTAPDCVYFYWRPVGNNGYVCRPSGPVIPKYNKCADFISPFSKVITRTSSLSKNVLETASILGSVFWHNMAPLMDESAVIVNVLEQDMRNWYNNFPNDAGTITSQKEFCSAVFESAFIYHISIKSEQDFLRRYDRGVGGQFYGQTVWRDIFEKGESDIQRYFSGLNAVEENRLIEIRHEMLKGSVSNQIIASPPGRNIALRCNALQSSISRWSLGADLANDAAGVVDGKPNGTFHHHTNIELEPWWQVDLGQIYLLEEIRIFNRLDNVWDRLRNFVVKGSLDGLKWSFIFEKSDNKPFGGVDGGAFIWTSDAKCLTRYIRICGVGISLLDFDQVEVYGQAELD